MKAGSIELPDQLVVLDPQRPGALIREHSTTLYINPFRARVYLSGANQTIAANVPTDVAYDSVTYDLVNAFSGGAYTCPEDGDYFVSACNSYTAPASGGGIQTWLWDATDSLPVCYAPEDNSASVQTKGQQVVDRVPLKRGHVYRIRFNGGGSGNWTVNGGGTGAVSYWSVSLDAA